MYSKNYYEAHREEIAIKRKAGRNRIRRDRLIKTHWSLQQKLDVLKETAKIVLCQYTELGECWLSEYGLTKDGYPVLWHDGKCHKVARWILINQGVDMNGLVTRHKCDTRNCINPDHLMTGTQKQNTHDAIERGRHRRRIVTENERQAIIKDYAGGGYTKQELAKKYHITDKFINQALIGILRPTNQKINPKRGLPVGIVEYRYKKRLAYRIVRKVHGKAVHMGMYKTLEEAIVAQQHILLDISRSA